MRCDEGDKMYKIFVKALQGNVLTFTVREYDVVEGFVVFTDDKTKKKKKFAVSNCEIEEVL